MDVLMFSRAMRAHGFRYHRSRKDVGRFTLHRSIAGRQAEYSVWVSFGALSKMLVTPDGYALKLFRDAEAFFAQLEAGL